MSLTKAINSSLNGIITAQKATSVVSENVANVKTEGYSYKQHSQYTRVLANGQLSGTLTNANLRQVDENLLGQLRKETGSLQSSSVKSYYLTLVQAQMGQPSSEYSVSNRVTAIQTAFESLGVDVDKLNAQSTAVGSIDTALSQIQDLSELIQAYRLEIDMEISSLCEETSDILQQLDKLNDDIVRTESIGQSSDNFRDQRDTLLTRLSEIMDVESYERSTGELVILTSGGKSLLDNDATTVSHNSASSAGSLISYESGSITGIYAGIHDITKEINTGELGGLIELRDKNLTEMQSQLDELSYQVTTQLNAVHNTGSNYPNMVYEMTGTRTFLDGDAQQISIEEGDVKITLFNEDGSEAYCVSLVGDLGFQGGSVNEMCETVQDWLTNAVDGPNLKSANIGLNKDGKLEIDLGSSQYSMNFRDETSVLLGSEQKNATIGFDADGNGTIDETNSGFSSFFGLNDLIVSNTYDSVYESDILSSGSLMGIAGSTSMNFSDSEYGLNFASVNITSSDTLSSISDKINAACVSDTGEQIVKAEVIQEGSGYRLRITNIDGNQMEVTENTSTVNGVKSGSILSRLKMNVSHAGYASTLSIRDDILNSPALLNTGTVQYSSKTGEYFVSNSDNSLANKFSEVFTKPVNFSSAGSFSAISTTLSGYASSIVNGLATNLSGVNSTVSYQTELVSTIYTKTQEVSGVDLDQELAKLSLYQRSFSASSKALSTCLEMLELLDSLI